MNILIINGSPRGKNSNSQKICDTFIAGMNKGRTDLSIERLFLKESNLQTCTGCYRCWSQEEPLCILKDDMKEMLDKYIRADLVFWVTPLYHYTITSLMKRFIERTLPLNSPLQVRKGEHFHHPGHHKNLETQKHILVSACGFPEHGNFHFMKDYMSDICHGNIVETIFCGMTELFRQKELEKGLAWYFDALLKAGREYSITGSIGMETKEILEKDLVTKDLFVQMTNMHWREQGNMDHLKYEVTSTDRDNLTLPENRRGRGYAFLENMKDSFNKGNNLKLKGNIEFRFNDLEESAFFAIDGDDIELTAGPADGFVLKIITDYTNWLKVSTGEVDGAAALMQGLYRIEGDMSILMKMGTLFSTEKKAGDIQKTFYGIGGYKWMTIAFIPWIISWITVEHFNIIGSAVPLFLSLLILVLKKKQNGVTYFEQMNGLYFLCLTVFAFVYPKEIMEYGTYINLISMAAIWGFSVFGKFSLTADYSIFDQEGDLSENVIFHRTNEIITLFWTGIYVFQAVLNGLMDHFSVGLYSPLIYLLVIAGFKFTGFFSKWYPEYIMKRPLE